MSRLIYKSLPTITELVGQSRAFCVALLVVATLVTAFDADALSGSKSIKYGTLSYSIPNLGSSYKPGEHYTLSASFHGNEHVYGKYTGVVTVSAGGRTLCRSTVIVQKGKTSSTSLSFTAPDDGSTLSIKFGDAKGAYLQEAVSIPPMQPEPEPEPAPEEDTSTPPVDEANSDAPVEDPNDTHADESSADSTGSSDNGFLPDLLDNEFVKDIMEYWATDPLGLDHAATPDEAAEIGGVAAILSLLLGGGLGGALGGGVGGALGGLGGGAAGGAAGGGGVPPVDGPGGSSNPYQGIEDKYVTRDSDGSITIKDPITGEEKLYLPDGQGGYDNPLGGGFQSEQDMLEHLAYLDRNSDTLSQDAATAERNRAEQHAQWEEQSLRDAKRGYSDESADYKKWREEEERKTEQIIKFADKYHTEASEEAVREAIKKDQIKAGIEAARQEAIAADKNVTVVGLESTRNVATTSLALIPIALSGVGTVSVATMAKAKVVQSCYTMAKEVTDKVGDAYVKGGSLGKATAHGLVTGTIEVAKNYAGDIGGKVAKIVPKVGETGQKIINLVTEAGVVIGGDGVKAGLDEYNKSGDLKTALDESLKGMAKSAKTHLVNKVAEYGIDKGKQYIQSRTSTAVQRTQVKADEAAKKVTAGQQTVSRTQKQVSEARQRVSSAQQNAARARQQMDSARGEVNRASAQLNTANDKVAAAQRNLSQAKTAAEAGRARTELANAQEGARQAQQNLTRANSALQSAQRSNTAAQRVAVNAENSLQKAQWGAQKAQSDLRTATAQHQQAQRDVFAAEQQAQLDKFNEGKMQQVAGEHIVGGYRAVEDHLKEEGYIPKDDN